MMKAMDLRRDRVGYRHSCSLDAEQFPQEESVEGHPLSSVGESSLSLMMLTKATEHFVKELGHRTGLGLETLLESLVG